MIYHPKNRKNNIFLDKKFILIYIFILLFFFGNNIKSFLNIIHGPISISRDVLFTPFQSVYDHISSKQKLIEKNEFLINENKRLNIELLTIDALKKENDYFKNVFQYKTEEQSFVLAKILNSSFLSPYNNFTINAGEEKNIKTGEKVNYLNIPIGEVEKTYKNSSLVRLYSSPEKTINVDIGENKNIEAQGIGSGGFLIMLPKDISINEKDTVYFEGVPFGIVESIQMDNQNTTFQNIYFRYVFELRDLNFVEIKENKNDF